MVGHLLLCILLFLTIQVNDGAKLPLVQKKFKTLNGGQPEVVALGGYSGFFPSSSMSAYDFSHDVSMPGTIQYCNVHFSKDNVGFCIAQINLMNTTSIEEYDPKGIKEYNVYGQQVRGYFGVDYPANVLFENVTIRQNIYTRSGVYDGAPLVAPFQLFEDKKKIPTRVWLNIENYMFYKDHKIDVESFLLNELPHLPEFLSSPEIGFLKSIGAKAAKSKTKLILTFLGLDEVEPTTKKPYGSLIKDLSMIKSFASGIVVPKEYIWPVDKAKVLLPATTLVQDAHKAGLSVYASSFANDRLWSYNFSYDPVLEYVHFTDNSEFSVDGVLSEFPSTASEAIGCINVDKKAPREVHTLIISHNGASGDIPGSTDAAYNKAVADGADAIDCSVQMSKDGVAFCSDRADLMKTTNAAAMFIDRSKNVKEIQSADGVFSFELTWNEIQTLKPKIESFFPDLPRNPVNKNNAKLLTLPEFLELAKTVGAHGVFISIRNAAFLASKKGLDIVGTVSSALSHSKFDKQTLHKVMVESDDTSVLDAFKDVATYERVLYLKDAIGSVPDQAVQEVKKHANAVNLRRNSITVAENSFIANFTQTVPAFHAANISVYVGYLRNEYQNLALDYLADPYVEIATLTALQVDGFLTDYPYTANLFSRSSCLNEQSPYVIMPVQPGMMFPQEGVAEPPQLSPKDVVDPPLPPVAKAPSPLPAATPNKQTSSTTNTLRVSAQSLYFAALVLLLTIYT
ncbi:glycerophosphodiester phosphodiesterase GDPDL6-like isoform X1 [Salvia hispanica]|uniref:glycerophosphodiester phosphodiesterase GDPDL6-like isoform X1 n=1 Tax=Salvia hispanica TaxID=49212 RepID=UPI002008F750|nr:glycerophosphodiester phosphodiesterase GDPDL6-like isoform X1 [Salvia hispanica]